MSKPKETISADIQKYLKEIHGSMQELLINQQAIISNSHLVLTSDHHSDGYINVRMLAGSSEAMDQIGYSAYYVINLIESADCHNPSYDDVMIVGPETMGRSLAQATSENFLAYEKIDVPYVWCEANAGKTAMQWNSKMPFAERIAGKRCYIVDDVLTTAKTTSQTIQLIEDSGGIIAGVIVAVQRNASTTAETLAVPWLIPLYQVELQDYDPKKCSCPLCERRVPIRLHPGHGHEWIENHPDYPTES